MRRRHALALEGGQAAGGAESLDGGGNGGFGVLAASLHHAGDQAAIVGSADLDDVAVFSSTGHPQRNRGSQRARSSFPPFCLPCPDSDFDYRPRRLVAFLLATEISNTTGHMGYTE